MSARPPLIAVCGTATANEPELHAAEETGRLLAESGAIVVCGGLGGVMTGVSRGVRAAGGTIIGLLPGEDDSSANDDVTIAIPTGLGEMRNALIARSCAAMIAIGGGYGTLSEIGFALRIGKPVAGVHTWDVRRAHDDAPDPALHRFDSAREAVEWVLQQV